MPQIIERARKNLKPYISIFFATRKRVNFLNETLHSIYSLADPNNINFEVIIKVDFDDIETIEYIKNYWTNNCENIYFIISSRKEGFLSMTDFTEDMIDMAKGKYVWALNDDTIITTKNWNNILENKLREFKIYFTNTVGYKESFYCIPKKLYEVLGHISPHNQIDTYLHWLGNNLDICDYINDIFVFHRHHEFEDQTKDDKFKVQDLNYISRDYHKNSSELENDVKTLRKYIKTINDGKTNSL